MALTSLLEPATTATTRSEVRVAWWFRSESQVRKRNWEHSGNGDGNTTRRHRDWGRLQVGSVTRPNATAAETDVFYRITFRVRDAASGNTTTVSATVAVPRNPGPNSSGRQSRNAARSRVVVRDVELVTVATGRPPRAARFKGTTSTRSTKCRTYSQNTSRCVN